MDFLGELISYNPYNPVTSTLQPSSLTMICSATFAVTLFLTQAARALPQPGSPSIYPASSTEGSSYSSTQSPYSSPYSTTEYYPKTTDYTSSPYAPKESYPSGASDKSSCYPTPTPYPSMNKGNSYSSSYYPTTTSNCSSAPYSSQPSYTSSYPSPKETYPPTTSPYPYKPPTKPSDGNNKPEPGVSSSTLRATYDTTYDNKSGSMNGVACSNGANGLAARFPTFGDVPSFPFIGGAFDVVWNSPNCGACWNLTNMATGVSISLTAVDSAGSGFNIAQEAFEKLNNGQIGSGVLDVVANKISPSVCGLQCKFTPSYFPAYT